MTTEKIRRVALALVIVGSIGAGLFGDRAILISYLFGSVSSYLNLEAIEFFARALFPPSGQVSPLAAPVAIGSFFGRLTLFAILLFAFIVKGYINGAALLLGLGVTPISIGALALIEMIGRAEERER